MDRVPTAVLRTRALAAMHAAPPALATAARWRDAGASHAGTGGVPSSALARAAHLARRAGLVFGVWTLVALVTTQQAYYTLTRTGQPASWEGLLTGNLASCWLWALFTPPIVALARRFPVTRDRWQRAGLLHLAFGIGFHLADAAVQLALPSLFSPGAPTPPLGVALVRHTFLNLSSYLVVLALASAAGFARLSRERELAAARLAEQLSAARLHALQSQLRPHFLFNTLNTIAEQVHRDAAGADRMLMRLSALLRASFAEGEVVSLRTELEVVRSYIEIMAVRFRGRVAFAFDVEPAALDALVPRFLLQPLVENALRHGIEPVARGGRVEIVVRRRLDVLEIEVRDSGRGLASPSRDATAAGAAPAREGVGLRNTRDRLAQLYGDAYGLALRPRADGGAIAAVTLPVRPRSAA